jgi:putative hemolysin
MNEMTDSSADPLVNTALMTFSSYDVLLLIVLLLLLSAAALFAGAEVALFSISKNELEQLEKSQSKRAKIAEKLLEKPKELLATILIVKNFLNVLFVVIATYLLIKYFAILSFVGVGAYATVIVIVTLLIIFVGESYPKTIAFSNKAAYARFMAMPVYFFSVLPPFSWLKIPLSKSSNVLERRAKKKGIKLSKDALDTVLTLTESADKAESDYNILQGVLKFGNTDVKQVMCPRVDVVGVDDNSTLEELMQIVVNAGYSRVPVYKESFDTVIGVIYVKDLLPFLALGNQFDWHQMMRVPMFVPENKKIDELLKEFQSKKVHMAIVIDEYGGASGIVTLEDVLEEIVGDITDEYDDEELEYQQLNDTTFVFQGRTDLDDFYKTLAIDEQKFEEMNDDAETLGGFLTHYLGRIPKVGEIIEIEQLKFIIEQADKKRIKSIKVIVLS